MAKHRAYVYKETKGIDEYRVYPGIVIMKKNDDFELVNLSGDTAIWKTPAGLFDDEATAVPVADNSGVTKTAKPVAQAKEYSVEVNGKRAKGNSDPVIIIDL